MDTERFREPEGGVAWLDPVLVVCPRCEGRAVVRETGRDAARLTCPHCALSRGWSLDRYVVERDGHPTALRMRHGHWWDAATGELVGRPRVPEGVEERFGVPLWLRAECCGGHLLWATNEAHLDYLESYLGARLRERPPMPSGLSWYLPAWMKRAGHRDEVLRTIGRMRATLG